MRSSCLGIAALMLASGCGSMNQFLAGESSVRPTVMRSMTEETSDADKQNEQRANAHARPDADSRKGLSRTARQVETVAASVAVFVGMFYSTSPNVLPGVETDFEENLLFDPHMNERPKGGHDEDEKEAPPPVQLDEAQPVPWVHF